MFAYRGSLLDVATGEGDDQPQQPPALPRLPIIDLMAAQMAVSQALGGGDLDLAHFLPRQAHLERRLRRLAE